MRKPLALASAGLCIAAAASAIWFTPVFARTETVTGKIVDLACYARNKANTGLDHDRGVACAQACVRWEGQPVGLVTDEGKVYQFAGQVVAGNNAKLAPHLAHMVTVTGDVYEKDGMPMIAAAEVKMVKPSQ